MAIYRSIFPKRTASVGVDDFAKAARLTLNGKEKVEEITGQDLDLWDKTIPYTPEQVYQIFTGGHQQSINVMVEITPSHSLNVTLQPYNSIDFNSSLQLEVGEVGKVLDSYVSVAQNMQGSGIGRTIFQNKVEFSVAMGAPSYRFMAGLNNGGHSWFRAKAYMDMDEEHNPKFEEERSKASLQYHARLEAVRGAHVIPGDYFEAKRYADLTVKDDPTRLAAMNYALLPIDLLKDPRDAEKIERSLQDFYSGHGIEDANGVAQRDMKQIHMTFGAATKKKLEAMPLARFMQAGTDIPAIIEFTDAQQMQAVRQYHGAWRSIQLVPEAKAF